MCPPLIVLVPILDQTTIAKPGVFVALRPCENQITEDRAKLQECKPGVISEGVLSGHRASCD